MVSPIVPGPIRDLPKANISLNGLTSYILQSETHQILFMEFDEDVDLPEHSHAAQVGIVLEGKIELIIDGEREYFTRGDRYYIPKVIKNSGKIFAGYADITFFDEPNRFSKQSE